MAVLWCMLRADSQDKKAVRAAPHRFCRQELTSLTLQGPLLLSTTAWDWELNNEDKLRQPAAVLLDSAGTLRYDYPKAALDTLWGLGLIDAQ
jgi:hypothetical protein